MQLPEQLKTDRLILRPHVQADLPDFLRLINNEKATSFVNLSGDDRSEEGLEAFFQDILASQQSDQPVFGLAILEKGSRKYVGFCGLSNLPDHSGAETYYVLHPDTWGKGYATEAAQILFEYAFSVLNLASLHTYLVEKNVASVRVAEKLGMKNTGVSDHPQYHRAVSRFEITKDEYFPAL